MIFSIQDSLHVREAKEVWEAPHTMVGHTHNFDHLTVICGGKWRIRQWQRITNDKGEGLFSLEGEELWSLLMDKVIDASYGFKVNIPAAMKHTFDLIEGRGRYYCIYPSREPDTGEVVHQYNHYLAASQ